MQITIDRTYVESKNTLYNKTLIDEDEWKLLCELEHQTNFGKTSSKEQHHKLVEIYSQLIMSYVAQGLSDFGYDLDGIFIYMKDASKFMVEIYKNKVKNYNYFGKW